MIHICSRINEHFKGLIRALNILWSVTLDDGTKIYSDYYVKGLESPWLRVQKYCAEHKRYIVKVSCIMFGANELTMFEDPNGLDGVFVLRGSSKDITINDSGDTGVSFKSLIVGVLCDDNDTIAVKKFSWPENELEPFEQTRKLTKTNFDLMIFKDEQRRQTLSEKF